MTRTFLLERTQAADDIHQVHLALDSRILSRAVYDDIIPFCA
jgi:hypothetical protein